VYESHYGPLSSVRAPVIAVGVTLLKALSMSRNAAREYSLLWNPLSILATREWRAVSVDLPLRYACCASERRLWLVQGLYQEGRETNRAEVLWVAVGGFAGYKFLV